MKEQKERKPQEGWKTLVDKMEEEFGEPHIPLSIIIPTRNHMHSVAHTLESISRQNYTYLDIIIIDAGSTDRTLSIIKSFMHLNIRVYSVAHYHVYEMFNRGLRLATGDYVQFLVPGDFYVSPRSLAFAGHQIEKNARPDFFLAGSLARYGVTEPYLLNRSLDIHLLKQGKQPASIQACLFERQILQKLGGFDTSFHLRSGLELFCRLLKESQLRFVQSRWVLIDADRRALTHKSIMLHFWDTLRVLRKYFGWWQVLCWLWIQKDSRRIFNLWYRHIKTAFMGRQYQARVHSQL